MYAAGIILLCVLPSLCYTFTSKPGSICVKSDVTAHTIDTTANSFIQLIHNSTVFVDKTLFIKEMLEVPHSYIFISAPPKFGKSINLDMLRHFIEIQVDKFGEPLPRFETSAYLLFKQGLLVNGDRTEQFSQPIIARHTFLFDDYLCRYPVIHLDFSDVQATNFKDFKHEIAQRIKRLFAQHTYVIYMLDKHESSESSINRHKFLELLNYVEQGDLRLEHSVRFLSQILSKLHRKGVFILIDGFDVLFDLALHGEFENRELRFALEFLRYFYRTTFYQNICIKKTIVMALNRNSAIFLPISGKTLIAHHALHNQFFTFFGISQIDADLLSDVFGISAELRANASEFYSGYQFGQFHVSPMYNPMSLANFLNAKSIASYWLYSSKTRFYLRHMMRVNEIRKHLERLYHGELIIGSSFSVNYTAAVGKLQTLRDMIQRPRHMLVSNTLSRAIVQYLADNGFVTFNRTERHGTKQQRLNHLRLPNQEIRNEIFRDLRAYYTENLRINPGAMFQLTEHLNRYIMGETNNNELVREAFNYVISDLRVEVDIGFKSVRNFTRYNHTIVNSVIEFLTIELRQNYGYQIRVFSVPGFKAYKDNRGAVIKTNYFYNSTPETILASGQKEVWFPEAPNIADPKIMVIDFKTGANNSIDLYERALGPQNVTTIVPPAADPDVQPLLDELEPNELPPEDGEK